MTYIEGIAEADILRWKGSLKRPPAWLLEHFVRSCGLQIDHRTMFGNMEGELDLGSGTIWLNSQLPDTVSTHTDLFAVSNWVIAHELGHWRLHRACLAEGQRRPDMEAEADAYAAALLMPRQACFLYANLSRSLERFCEHFQVSKQAARIRLKEIGLLVPTSGKSVAG